MNPVNDALEVLKTVPLIPLRDLVVFPSTLVPFIIGRPSSILALEKAGESEKTVFLAAQMDPSLDNPTPKDIHSFGITARVIRTVSMDDKNVKVIVEGRRRARILEYVSSYPFYQVLVKEIPPSEEIAAGVADVLKRVILLFEEYLKVNQNANFQSIIPALRDHSPERIADIISSHMFIPLEEKQNLLETVQAGERLNRLDFLLQHEINRIQAGLRRKNGKSGQSGRRTEGGTTVFQSGGKKEDQSLSLIHI